MGWIQSQYAKQGIDLKAQAQGSSNSVERIIIENSPGMLPGTNITMPTPEQINGKRYDLLEHQNPSTIDGMHTAEPHTPTVVDVPNAPAEPDPT